LLGRPLCKPDDLRRVVKSIASVRVRVNSSQHTTGKIVGEKPLGFAP